MIGFWWVVAGAGGGTTDCRVNITISYNHQHSLFLIKCHWVSCCLDDSLVMTEHCWDTGVVWSWVTWVSPVTQVSTRCSASVSLVSTTPSSHHTPLMITRQESEKLEMMVSWHSGTCDSSIGQDTETVLREENIWFNKIARHARSREHVPPNHSQYFMYGRNPNV